MKLKELRVLNKLTQQEIADKLLIQQTTYCNYEKEKTQPPIELLIKIANFFNVSLDYLCENEQTTKNVLYLDNLDKEQQKIIQVVKDNQPNEYDAELIKTLFMLNEYERCEIKGKIENMIEKKTSNTQQAINKYNNI